MSNTNEKYHLVVAYFFGPPCRSFRRRKYGGTTDIFIKQIIAGAREPFFNREIKVKNKVLSYNMIG